METHWKTLPSGDLGVVTAPVRASDNVERLLRALIFSGRLAPGDKLPAERDLALELGVSRPTARLALNSLNALGYLVVKIGSKGGYWVADVDSIKKHWKEWMEANRDHIEEMLDFRRWVEIEIAARAAERRTDEDIRTLEALGHGPTADRPSYVQWHIDLHDAMARASHNRYLEQAGATIRGELFIPVGFSVTRFPIEEAVALHRPLVAAICAGDRPAAVEAMTIHMARLDEPFRSGV
jgi:GntR family transcriptional regulator, transcriptional repressor for pyruvate dehydrogenase complex